ncbi:2-methylcitrate dehydratase PrpD [Rhodococcus percolatus]|uniref:MmgE/PrpD family protein n=1 Tax=Rhodococcus opacus TaxID=37919 RepID=UPI0015F8767A|nr:MmgE/PrpD family protein [Rhodococcus opacus]MBA8962893.1 2-methylcitrate dehydratase PrpD [Rhodococcus opacus]MBP2206383.1 2-methylcitrate dehydratase PrpD [Rhodococcus opacus]
MTSSDRLTWNIAEWIVDQQQRPLPERMDHHVRRLLLDHLAGVVASSPGAVSGAVGEHVHRMYPGTTATAIGHGRSSALGAALINGTNGHGIETDEGYTPGSMHPTSVIFPAVFAVAQEKGISGDRVLTAAAIGMELSCRIAAAGHPATRNRHFHNTAIAGVFGAAAAVAVLLELDVTGVANTLGIAGSHASGLFEFLGQSAEIKRFHPGKAARDGITSADLAQAGLTGPTTILEGKDGYFAAYAGVEGTDWDPGILLGGLGEEWVLLGTYVKPYPCCRHLHGAIDAALHLVKTHTIDPADIASVTVGTFAIATRHAGRQLDTILQAQLSLPFTVAVALLRGGVTLTDFSEDTRSNIAVQALMNKVQVVLDDAADAAYPKSGRPADVTVVMNDGTRYQRRVEQPYGEPSNPLSDSDLEGKARALVEPVIGADGTKNLIESSWNFDSLEFLDFLDFAVRNADPR